jgi:dihydropteroate synthase
MGIINVTEDSFYSGSRATNEATLIEKATKHIEEGASILDIGAMSSRPGARISDPKEEAKTVVWALDLLTKRFDTIYSVDTLHSHVAQEALQVGAAIINDISASEVDPKIIDVVKAFRVPYIAMHMQGLPETMQNDPQYVNVSKDIFNFFAQKIQYFSTCGIEELVIDVGFGFGKTIQHNYQLLNSLDSFIALRKPILVGLSRKSMLYKALEISQDESLNSTTAVQTIALLKGANILRVHDVKEAVEVIKILNLLSS